MAALGMTVLGATGVAAGCSSTPATGPSATGSSTTTSGSTGGSSATGAAGTSGTTAAAPGTTAPVTQTAGAEVQAGDATLTCEGEGRRPIVLLAGGRDPGTVWDELRALLGPDQLVCVFDRPGLAELPTTPLTPGAVADGLDAVLAASDLDGPFVFVGHSLGGLSLRQFGAAHPDLVAGAVFLDPTVPAVIPFIAADLATIGWDAEATTAEVAEPITWPEVPVTVLSRDPALLSLGVESIEEVWTNGQRDYAALVPDGTHAAVPGANHYVFHDDPERVRDEILALLEP